MYLVTADVSTEYPVLGRTEITGKNWLMLYSGRSVLRINTWVIRRTVT